MNFNWYNLDCLTLKKNNEENITKNNDKSYFG